jgi:1-acyl-sn-glycerol-3-phosphate acyltransferase
MIWDRLTEDAVRTRLDGLDLTFNRYGLDAFGISRAHLGALYTLLGRLYHQYFRVETHGIEHVPATGRAMIIGNHSGGLPVDASMALASLFFEPESPRHGHGMVEKFAQNWPFLSPLFSRLGQLAGLPEHAIRILEDERLLMVFPEGARGTGKLYKDKYKLVRFGTGFMRIALETKSPIVPFAFVGGEEALPVIYHAKWLAKLTGAPYWPVTPYVLPVPLPVPCQLYYGEPMHFEGTGHEADHVIDGYVQQVKQRIAGLIDHGRQIRSERAAGANP